MISLDHSDKNVNKFNLPKTPFSPAYVRQAVLRLRPVLLTAGASSRKGH